MPPSIVDTETFQLACDILAAGMAGSHGMALRLALMKPGFNWQRLVDVAEAQGLMEPLVASLQRGHLLLPVPASLGPEERETHASTRLKRFYQQHLARRDDLRDQVLSCVDALNRRGIEPLLLKGARSLLAPFSPWCEARAMRDLDLLVPAESLDSAMEALLAIGYAFIGSTQPLDHHAPPLHWPGRHGSIELHADALAIGGRKVVSTAEVWQRAERCETEGGVYHVLQPAWHVAHGFLHHQVSDRGHRRRILAAKGLFEFAAQFPAIAADDWRAVERHVEARGQIEALDSFVIQAATLFGIDEPPTRERSEAARRHAAATLAGASESYGRRRLRFIIDQLRFAFSRETLAHRYGIKESDVTVFTAMAQTGALIGRYRSLSLVRLFGRADRPS